MPGTHSPPPYGSYLTALTLLLLVLFFQLLALYNDFWLFWETEICSCLPNVFHVCYMFYRQRHWSRSDRWLLLVCHYDYQQIVFTVYFCWERKKQTAHWNSKDELLQLCVSRAVPGEAVWLLSFVNMGARMKSRRFCNAHTPCIQAVCPRREPKIHPSIIYDCLTFGGSEGADPSGHWVSSRIHPWQLATWVSWRWARCTFVHYNSQLRH